MKRCGAVSPKGTVCRLEEGHYDHLVHRGLGKTMDEAWDDDAGRVASVDPRVLALRKEADEAWARGSKEWSTSLHGDATRLRGKIRQEILDRERARDEEKEIIVSRVPYELIEDDYIRSVKRGEMENFRPGIYMHYKGPLYAALMLVRHHETREPMVVYTSLEKGNVQVREFESSGRGVDAWTDVVEWKVPLPDGSAATHGPRFVFARDFA